MPTKALNGLSSASGQFKMRVMLQGPLTEEQKSNPDARVLDRPKESEPTDAGGDTNQQDQTTDNNSEDNTD